MEEVQMEMRVKVTICIVILIAFVIGYTVFISVSTKRNQEEAIKAADRFVTAFYDKNAEGTSLAYGFVSEGFKAAQSEGALRGMKDGTAVILGDYVSHRPGVDVTKAFGAARRNVRIFNFDTTYQNDPEGRISVVTVKEKGVWKIQAININSPKITETQTRQTLGLAPASVIKKESVPNPAESSNGIN